ncbi:MAG: PKD domain-containing protein [Micropruina sp.]
MTILLAALLTAFALPVVRSEAAEPEAAAATTPATVTADALPTWQINGVVWSQAIIGDTVYVTGSFTKARPPGVSAGGTGEVTANNIFAYSLSTGARVAAFAASLNAQGLVIRASADGSRLWVGGDFTTVNGSARGHLAALNPTDGSLVSLGTTPNVSGQVRGLGITSSTIYVGGNFLSANGVARTRLVAYSTSTGAISTTWAPSAAGGYVWAMTMTPDKTRVIPAGSFTTLNGQAAYGMGSVSASDSTVLYPWPAQEKIRVAGANGAITAVKADSTQIYGTSYAFGAGASFEGTFAIDPMSGEINWLNDCLGDTYDIAQAGDVLYNASHQHDCTVVNGFPDTNPRVRWQKAGAQYSHATGVTTKNDAYGWGGTYGLIGLPYAALLHWYPNFAFGSYTSSGQAAWAVNASADGQWVVFGGEFPRVNGTAQQGLVRFRNRAGAPNTSGPTYTTIPATATPTTTAASLAAGEVRVSFGSAWDMDDEELTYALYRNNTLINTQTAKSNFWTLPRLGYIDKNLTVGTSVTYQVKITDANGNSLWSLKSNTVTVGSAAPSPYANLVRDDGAQHLWRLGESSGATLDWASFDDLTMSGGYTRSADGAISSDTDKSTTFGGSDGLGATSSPVDGPDVFSVEAWFKTTSTSGGKIVGFGNANTGTSTSYDRHIYMEPNGKVTFGVWNNGSYTVSSPSALNDGAWHHVVGTMESAGVTLYVNGKKIGRNSGTSIAQPYAGYWRVGGDSPWSGNAYFAGDIDDVAIYPTAIPLATVQSHYVASGRTLDVPTRPSDTYGQAVWDANPDLYWRLGDTTTTATDSSPNDSPGIYQGGYTQGVDGAFNAATNKAVLFGGSDGFVASSTQFSNPRTYSLEAWFKTTSTDGGKILGFGCSQTGTSGCYDRHIYVSPNGTLTFGVWTGSMNTITTPGTVNNGQWHHVVATQNTTEGMKLYLDGALVGTNPQTDAQNYSGYWRVGGDNHWGGGSAFLNGTIDEVAVYSSVLSPSTVAGHFQAGGGSLPNQAPTAAFTHAESDLKVSVNGSTSSDSDGTIASFAWDFGGAGTGSTSGATTSFTYAAAGTYTVTLTVTDDDGATATETHSVTVAAPPANQAPTAAFTYAESDLKVSVNGSGSSDADGTIASFAWDFGGAGTGSTSGATTSFTYAAAGTYTVTLTVTDDDGATATETHSVTVAAPPANQVLASDDFGRTASNSWGSADTGGAWTLSGPAARWSVANGRGLVSLNKGDGYTASLTGVSTTESDVSLSIGPDKVATGGGQYISVIGRRISTTADYRAKVQITSTGAVNLWLTRMSSGTETNLIGGVVSGLTYSAGERLEVRLQVTGTSPTTLKAKVWKSGGTEPTAWTRTATDSTSGFQSAGWVAVYYYVSSSSTNEPVVFSTDGVRVSKP